MTGSPDPVVRRVRCPHCGSTVSHVYTTRAPDEDGRRLQYRRCGLCELTFKTILEAENPAPTPAGQPGGEPHPPRSPSP